MSVQTDLDERDALTFELGWTIGRGEKFCGLIPSNVVAIIARLPKRGDGTIVDFDALENADIAGLCASIRGAYLAVGVPESAFRAGE